MTASIPDPNDLARSHDPFVDWVRQATPYIHAHRGRTFVVAFGGEAVADPRFPDLVHDIALLHGLGIRLVLVHGARPQIEARLAGRGAAPNSLRTASQASITEPAIIVSAIAGTIEPAASGASPAAARPAPPSASASACRPRAVVDG